MKKWGRGLPVTVAVCMMFSLVALPEKRDLSVVYAQTDENSQYKPAIDGTGDSGNKAGAGSEGVAGAEQGTTPNSGENGNKDNTEDGMPDDKNLEGNTETGNAGMEGGNQNSGNNEGTPGTGEPETGTPGTGEPETGTPGAGEPETGEPETGTPGIGEPETGEPETGTPGAGEPETGEPEAGTPGTEEPETGVPDTGEPETGALDGVNPETGKELEGEQPELLPEPLPDNQLKPALLLQAQKQRNSVLPPGTIEAGSEKTVAEALGELTEEAVEEAGGEIILLLKGNTKDGKEIFVPMDLGIAHLTITSEDGVDYQIGERMDTSFFANGIPTLWEHGIVSRLFGGGKNIPLDCTELTITGGRLNGVPDSTKGVITGGSYAGENGADISISGSCNLRIEINNLKVSSIFGGNFTEASNVTATVGETNVEIVDSEIEAGLIAGGSFLWGARNHDVNVDAGSVNLYFERSHVLVGHMDWTDSVYGGHIGNDEISNTSLHCDSTNITVLETEIGTKPSLKKGGELFGGSYQVSPDGSNEVSTGAITIDLINSTMNGVFGGGLYQDQCYARTGAIEINVENCNFRKSTAVGVPIVCGGDIYFSDTNYGDGPTIDQTAIHLTGEITAGACVYAEGVAAIGDGMFSMHPSESHLTVEEDAFTYLDGLDYDSMWTDVTLMGTNGNTQIVSEFSDFDDLKEKIAYAMLIIKTESGPGEVITDISPQVVETPALPENVTITEEEAASKKEQAIGDAAQSLLQTANEKKETTLNNALKNLGPDVTPGDTVTTFIQVQLKKLDLAAEVKGEAEVIFVPKKMILEITPCLKVDSAGGQKQSVIQNDQLNGEEIVFYVGVPPSVKSEYANVVHHASDGDESYKVRVQQNANKKFIELRARKFSEFEIEFLDENKGETPSGKPDDRPDNRPDNRPDDKPDTDPITPTLPTYQSESSSGSRLYSQPGTWVEKNKRWYYYNPDGSMLRQQWAYLFYGNSYSWYYFDANGMMTEGWLELNGVKYFLHDKADGTRGHLYTGWKRIDERWYYFEPSAGKNQGRLYLNTITPDGYQVGEDGSWIS